MKRREFLIKSTFTALAASAIPSSLLANAKESQMILFDRHINPRIIVSSNASAPEKFAAQELAEYLQKISGQKIVIQESDVLSDITPLIIVGNHPANADLHPEKMGEEDSVVDVSDNRIRIVGGKGASVELPNGTWTVQERGTLYGVYNFLDELGVRWYRPDPWGEHVPQMQTVKVLLGRRDSNPAFLYRWGISGYRYWSDDKPETRALAQRWATRNRQNTMVWTSEAEGGYHRLQIRHIYAELFPAEKYFVNHPEYFALVDGKRRKDGQLCVGNPDVQKLTVEKITQFAKENPEYESHSLEPNDNDIWCQCELCTALDDPHQKSIFTDITLTWERPMGEVSMSNRVCAFGSAVAESVYQTNKQLKIIWLAYSAHTEPPSKIKKLPPNVRIMTAAFSSAFTDPVNSYSDYSRDLYDPKSKPNKNFVRVLEGFGKMAPLMTYEYWGGLAWVGPMPLIRTMQDRLKAYQKLKMEGLYNEVYLHWGSQGIGLYFFTRVLWNPDLNIEKELDLYCKNYYGPAYRPMLEYHRLLEDAAHAGIPFYSYGIEAHAIFTPQIVERMDKLINEAKVLLGDKQPYAKRFEGVWAGYEYTRLVMPYFDELKKGNKLEAAKHWERANRLILSYKDGDVFDNGVLFGSLQFFGNYNLNIPADIQQQAKDFVAQETTA